MNWPIPIVEKIKWVFTPPSPSTLHSNDIFETKFKELSDDLCEHKTQITNLNTSHIYAQRYSAFKLENRRSRKDDK